MNILFSALLAASPSPSPSVDPSEVWYSPGTVGFLAVFGITAAAIALIFDMVRRVRRIRYRAEIAARLDAEQETVTSEKPAATVKKAVTKPARPAAPAKPKRD
ncbi:hypothetical protein [Rhodoluna sp.]|uniref:hypothetical protein n=1 Tax=Rhodoluna sp. TaxID=1969481 RepID=UPI0025EBB296|nr:hypothetical protein [Rhodoluna sp.]